MMSSFTVAMTVSSLDGRRTVEVRALVDTASTLVVIPPSVARHLNLVPSEQRPFRLGDETRIELPVANAVVRVEGRETATRVAIGPSEGTPILGVTVLEILGLAVDPVQEKLVPVDYLFKALSVPHDGEVSPAAAPT